MRIAPAPRRRRRLGLAQFRERLSQSYLVLPLLIVAVALVCAWVLVRVDERLDREDIALAFTGGPESARTALQTISTSLMSLAGVVFSITIVALQLTSNQFSPRALRNFLSDRVVQAALGVFLATFAFSLFALREVRGEDALGDRFVPGITITAAFVLVALSLVMFIEYIHHIAQSLRAVNIIHRIAAETHGAIDAIEEHAGTDDHVADPDSLGGRPGQLDGRAARTVPAPRAGVVAGIDLAGIIRCAASADVVVTLVPRLGEFVPRGGPLLEVSGRADEKIDRRLANMVALARERSVSQDPLFGIRQLVDIGERALSPAVTDPTTAVQCLDQIHDVLRRLARTDLPQGYYADDDGKLRLRLQAWSYGEILRVSLGEIRHWGAASLQVQRRLRTLLADLATVTSGPERTEVARQLLLLEARSADLPPSERSETDPALA